MPEPNALLRAARERTPSRRMLGAAMSRDELAELVVQWLAAHDDRGRHVAFDGGHLGKIERGVVSRPRDHYVAALCAVLNRTEAELGFAQVSGVVTALPSASLSPPEAWELVDTLARSGISVETLHRMEQATLGYAGQYPSTPPGPLLASVSRQMTRIQNALDQPMSIGLRTRSVRLLGTLCGLAGQLWFDLGRSDRAAGFFDAGEMAGQEADDADLIAWLLATRSIVLLHLGRYGGATQMLVRAEEAAAVRSSARRQAWVTSLQARAAAACGARDRSRAALDRAGQHIAGATDAPSGADFFDVPRFEGVAGSSYMFMADMDRAIPLLTTALNRRAAGDSKGRALLRLDLAQCHAASGTPEEAARIASDALESARGTIVGPIVARLQEVRTRLKEWADMPAVRELDARVVELNRG